MAIDSHDIQGSSGRRSSVPEHQALVFIHGFLDSYATWGPLIEAMPKHAALSIAPDLRGAGRRQAHPGPYTLNHAVTDILELLDAQGLTNVALVGHSMGAQIAELIAWHAPERISSLTLITPTPLAGNVLPESARTMLRESGADALAQRDIRKQFSKNLNGDQLDQLVHPAVLMGKEAARAYYDAFIEGDTRGLSPCTYRGPTLILGATDDPVIPAKQVADIRWNRFPAAGFRSIDGSGHWPQLEQPERTAEMLASHLRLR
ncbi:pimeloyl-ACP methyl ester carboxylesterase [Paraburkholderia sp. GAS41]|uniref:alpha/beta fold hydrolase n=1 Tax=Paraburkholderia sp. GAS41 TaxID=3035134 RepID=UPI003D216ECE